MEVEELNLYDIPLIALRPCTRQIIINELNKKKILASEEGLPRDWRGLVHLTGLPAPGGDAPTAQLLTAWEKDVAASLGLLEQYLGQLDRWDIVDDIHDKLCNDAHEFTNLTARNNDIAAISSCDHQVLTDDDISKVDHGLELQMYDALLLYADEDFHFAQQMLDKLENDYGLKLCLRENLVGGLSFEHQGVMRLINERCRRVIIIISKNFINSPFNQFFLAFSSALAIEQRRRILIPCIYEREQITLPMEVNYLHKLDYNRVGLRHYNFWDQLRVAVVGPSTSALPTIRQPPVQIREINNSAKNMLTDEPNDSVKNKLTDEPTYLKPQMTSLSPFKHYKSVNDISSFKEDTCDGKLGSKSAQTYTCSSLNLSEKKLKAKSPSDFFRKLFKLDSKKKSKKAHKIAVRL